MDENSFHWLQMPSRVDTSLQSTSLGRPNGRVSFIQVQASCTLLFDMISRICWEVLSGRLMLGRILLASYNLQVALRAIRTLGASHWTPVGFLLRQEQLTLRLRAKRSFCKERKREWMIGNAIQLLFTPQTKLLRNDYLEVWPHGGQRLISKPTVQQPEYLALT